VDLVSPADVAALQRLVDAGTLTDKLARQVLEGMVAGEGSPEQIGFQHGYLLAPEIEDAFQAIQLRDVHDTKRDWQFFRQAARTMELARLPSVLTFSWTSDVPLPRTRAFAISARST